MMLGVHKHNRGLFHIDENISLFSLQILVQCLSQELHLKKSPIQQNVTTLTLLGQHINRCLCVRALFKVAIHLHTIDVFIPMRHQKHIIARHCIQVELHFPIQRSIVDIRRRSRCCDILDLDTAIFTQMLKFAGQLILNLIAQSHEHDARVARILCVKHSAKYERRLIVIDHLHKLGTNHLIVAVQHYTITQETVVVHIIQKRCQCMIRKISTTTFPFDHLLDDIQVSAAQSANLTIIVKVQKFLVSDPARRRTR
mmetsp:Transcript_41381/g.68098  ORF Transcript_41381/g.68098 Transcript_41381/m.68098 type:complete len:255 (-) Transcript_41381:197-961(-)